MLTPPPGINDDDIVAALRRGWQIEAESVAYAPLGFGSHHWTARTPAGDRYFVTVDVFDHADVDGRAALARLTAALQTAHTVGERMPQVLGPLPTTDGAVLLDLGLAAVTLFPALALVEASPAPAKDRTEVIDLLAHLHSLTPLVGSIADRDDLEIRFRHRLRDALDLGVPDPAAGPYTPDLATLLREHTMIIEAGLRRYDDLASRARSGALDWVITHGEPHPGNLLTTTSGLRLIDWDTAAIAPAARDLADFGSEALAHYRTTTGRAVPEEELELYRLRWELGEIAVYTAWFCRAHEYDADTEIAWNGLREAVIKLASMINPEPGG